jgi:hypothetical protein
VNVNRDGVTVTCAHTAPADARAVNVCHVAALVQYHVSARTTV